MGDWGARCDCCGWPALEEVMTMLWLCTRCHWQYHELATDETWERLFNEHRKECDKWT